MTIHTFGALVVIVALAYAGTFSSPALAQFSAPGFGGSGPGTTAKTTTVKSSKSNTSDRMGGGGGKGTAKTKTVKSSKSNSSDRMGGGGGGGPTR